MRRHKGATALALLAWLLSVVGAPLATARADESVRRRVIAVLEYRAGATGAPDLGRRLAAVLRATTVLTVLDPDDLRRARGTGVDDEIARCLGATACVGRLGNLVAADEVLLVGVSELGDLIVALRRIDVGERAVASRVAESISRDVVLTDATLEAWLRRLLPREDFLRTGTIVITSAIAGAVVELDGVRRGVTPLAPLVVDTPASYAIRVTKPGYIAFTARIQVPPDATVEVQPNLVPKQVAWYRKWWVWALAGTVIAGATISGTLLQEAPPTPTSVPGVLEW